MSKEFDLFNKIEESKSLRNELTEKPLKNKYEEYFKDTFILSKNLKKKNSK